MHPIYRLENRHQLSDFKGTINPIMVFKWLKVVKEAMAMFTMFDQEKVKYVAYLLKRDAKAC